MRIGTGFGVLAAIGLVAVSYNGSQEGSQLFLSERIEFDEQVFMQYVVEFGKNYGTKEEFNFRFAEFKKQINFIRQHDEKATGHQVGLNHMSDWTEAEYKRLLGFKIPKGYTAPETTQFDDSSIQIEPEIDWRDHGSVTEVKNQGACGSCWAFAAVGAMEGAHERQTGYLTSFSEQQLLDCIVNHQGCCGGCNGGLYQPAWDWLRANNQGAIPEILYPYTAKQGTCQKQEVKSSYIPNNYYAVQRSAIAVKTALNYRPIAVAIEAENQQFRAYTGGIISAGCGTNLDHAVTAIGYGTDVATGKEFFIIKNSWSAGWGEQGYARIAINQCGITDYPWSVTMNS